MAAEPPAAGRVAPTPWLWAIVVAFTTFTLVTSVSSIVPPGLVGIANTVLLVAFTLVHGITTYGARAMLWFIVVCLVVSNVAENASILTGFPFGHYHYTDVLGPKLFLVPVTIGGAYFGAGYLAWAVSLVLLGRAGLALDRFGRWAAPFVATVLMASWDFMLDPSASTINRLWVWEQGGGYFGVPFSNYLGWLLTVFVFFALFAGYAAASYREVVPARPIAAPLWAAAIAMYALLGARYVLTFAAPSSNKTLVDAAGHVWQQHDIYATTALAAIFTVLAFSALALIRLIDRRIA